MKPKILVPFDFSAAAEHALAWAAELQRTTGGGPLQLIHAINLGPIGAGEAGASLLRPSEAEVAKLEATMLAAAERHGAPARAEVMVRLNGEGDTILDTARARNVDLIVMGTHGRTGISRLVMGSVAEHVLRRADCPVVTIHGPRPSQRERLVGADFFIPEC